MAAQHYHPLEFPEELGGLVPEKIIHCNVWGDIRVDALAMAIIDTWTFQRLHYLHQTGILYKIFPTAKTSRFEHALGSYCLAKKFLHKLWITSQEVFVNNATIPFYLIPIAALCRDLGQGPFSNVFDRFLHSLSLSSLSSQSSPWMSSEYRSCCLLQDLISNLSFPYRISHDHMTFMKTLMCPNSFEHPNVLPWFRGLVSDPTGIDFPTFDYVLRDSKSLGIAVSFDLQRILENMRIIDDTLCFCTRIVDDMEMFLATRQRLYKTAYLHPRVRRFEEGIISMFHETMMQDPSFKNAVHEILQDRVDPHTFLEWTDVYFLAMWQKTPSWRSLEIRIQPRVEAGEHGKDIISSIPSIFQSTTTTTTIHNSRPKYWYHRKRPHLRLDI